MNRSERLAALEAFYAVDGPWASVDTAERLVLEAGVDALRTRVERYLTTIVLLQVVRPIAVALRMTGWQGRPTSSPCVDPDDVSFVPHVTQDVTFDVTPADALVRCPVQRTLAWYGRAAQPTMVLAVEGVPVDRTRFVNGSRDAMPREYHPTLKGRRSVFERDCEVEVDTDSKAMRSAIRRYRRLHGQAAAGTIGADAFDQAVARVVLDTGIAPDVAEAHDREVPVEQLAQDREMLRWLHRDDAERFAEAVRIRSRQDTAERWLDANDPEREVKHFDATLAVTGMLAGSREQLDREWLNARLSEVVADCKGGKLAQRLTGKARRDAIRKGVSLQHRYTLRRMVDAVAEKKEEPFAKVWAECESWRRAQGLTYEKAVVALATAIGGEGRELHPQLIHVRARNTWAEVARGTATARATVE